MNISNVISSIKLQLGLHNITLPFIDPITKETRPVENVLQEIISTITIPMYSQFVPWKRIGDCNVKDLKCLNEKEALYLLPAFLTITPIMYVSDVRMPYINTRGTYGDIAPAYGINRSAQGVITASEYMMLAGLMRAEPTFEYLGHNQIRLYGFPRTTLTFEVACEHMNNCETIEDGCYDSFMQLALLDTKIFLYNNLKYYNNIPTAFGNLDLKIDNYSNAEAERETLLDRWRDTFHLDNIDWLKYF